MKKQTISILSLSGIAFLLYSLSFFVFFISSLFVEPANPASPIGTFHRNIINALVRNRQVFGLAFVFLGCFGGIMLALEIKFIQDPKKIKILLVISILIGFICGIFGLHIFRTMF